MNNELLLLNKKHTDTLIENTRTRPQETLEFKMNKQMQTFSFNPPINLLEEGKWLLAVSSVVGDFFYPFIVLASLGEGPVWRARIAIFLTYQM